MTLLYALSVHENYSRLLSTGGDWCMPKLYQETCLAYELRRAESEYAWALEDIECSLRSGMWKVPKPPTYIWTLWGAGGAG